jgi:hypothetical protein
MGDREVRYEWEDPANHGDGSERYALPWTTLTMLLTAVCSVLVAVWEAGRLVIMVGAGVLLLARWIWQSRAAVVGYSRKQGRTTRH